jgi:hypothetical protein
MKLASENANTAENVPAIKKNGNMGDVSIEWRVKARIDNLSNQDFITLS